VDLAFGNKLTHSTNSPIVFTLATSSNNFTKWCDNNDQIEEAIAKVKIEISEEKEPKPNQIVGLYFANAGIPQMELDFTHVEIAPMENIFIHLCALIARRAVNPCFPCLACHKNFPWEESSHHTCIVEEGADLQNKSIKKIEELFMHRYLLRKYFSDVVNVQYRDILMPCLKPFLSRFLKPWLAVN